MRTFRKNGNFFYFEIIFIVYLVFVAKHNYPDARINMPIHHLSISCIFQQNFTLSTCVCAYVCVQSEHCLPIFNGPRTMSRVRILALLRDIVDLKIETRKPNTSQRVLAENGLYIFKCSKSGKSRSRSCRTTRVEGIFTLSLQLMIIIDSQLYMALPIGEHGWSCSAVVFVERLSLKANEYLKVQGADVIVKRFTYDSEYIERYRGTVRDCITTT